MNRLRWSLLLGSLGVLALAAGTTCTVLLDRTTVQCHEDVDCKSFTGHAICSRTAGVCIQSGLQPDDCFDGVPTTNDQFLNQCTHYYVPGENGKCATFDNCARLGVCDAGDTASDGLTPPPTPDAGTVAATDAGVPMSPSLPLCKEAIGNMGTPIYLTGSSNFLALLTKLAPIVTDMTRLVPVFKVTDSCTGARSMYPANARTDRIMRDPAPGSTGAVPQYYLADGPHDCMVGSEGVPVDVGESEIAAETCGLQKDPANVRHSPGPIIPILFVVPRKSVETTISAEAAHEILGNGRVVDPWNDSRLVYIRGAGTATTRLIGLSIDVPVPPNRFWGVDQGTAPRLANNLQNLNDFNDAIHAIGILGADNYDTNRFNLKALAFKAKGQTCAFLPDSTPFLKDKLNVRDGHYPIWGTLHFFASVVNGSYVSPQAENFISLFSLSPLPPDVLDAFILSSWIPECAMQVQRDTEVGDFVTNHPPAFPCGCHFDSVLMMGATPDGCTKCTSAADCVNVPGRQACNFGFCESLPPN